MKTLVVLFSLVLAGAQAHAASQFAGDYFTVLKSYFPSTPTGSLAGAINIKVSSEGVITGHGAFVDRTPISVTGMVKDTGDVVLYENGTKFDGVFEAGGRQFYIVFPENTITGSKLALKFPEAGIYHAKTSSNEKLLVFVDRDHSVHGIVYAADGTKTEIEGTANATGFAAQSIAGAIFKAKFDGGVSGTFTTPAGASGSLSGAKY